MEHLFHHRSIEAPQKFNHLKTSNSIEGKKITNYETLHVACEDPEKMRKLGFFYLVTMDHSVALSFFR
jgi:hypothetical protein